MWNPNRVGPLVPYKPDSIPTQTPKATQSLYPIASLDSLPEHLYRGDDRHYSEIFEFGFQPRGANQDLEGHVAWELEDSAFIATSKSHFIGVDSTSHHGYVYTIRPSEHSNPH